MLGSIFSAIAAVAAYRLRDTPLFGASCAVALAAFVALAAAALYAQRTGRPAPRWLVAAQHVSSGLGGFFLFVSVAMN